MYPGAARASSQAQARIGREQLRVEIEQRGDVCLVRFEGSFRTGSEDPDYLLAKLDEIRVQTCGKVVADFSGVPSAGSACLGLIAGLYRRSGGNLVMTGVQARVREALDSTGLSRIVPLAPDLDAGFNWFREPG